MTREKFERTFLQSGWGGESPSGPGSSIDYTREIRKILPGILKSLDCKVFFDAPCGDLNWLKTLDFDDITYIGGDISPSLIAALNNDTQHSGKKFLECDITLDILPKADFWLCRDVLFHLSNSDIFKVLFNFVSSQIEYLATTHHPQIALTEDCESSPESWRLVNLTAAPFGLPQPMYQIWDSAQGYPPRWLAIWSRHQVTTWIWHIQGVHNCSTLFRT